MGSTLQWMIISSNGADTIVADILAAREALSKYEELAIRYPSHTFLLASLRSVVRSRGPPAKKTARMAFRNLVYCQTKSESGYRAISKALQI
ncbi:MAG: hypothetical protein CMF67_04370 [Magnetovibrio sp.]|nr:hypothetical protein [Magnetovibrio sp.]